MFKLIFFVEYNDDIICIFYFYDMDNYMFLRIKLF